MTMRIPIHNTYTSNLLKANDLGGGIGALNNHFYNRITDLSKGVITTLSEGLLFCNHQ